MCPHLVSLFTLTYGFGRGGAAEGVGGGEEEGRPLLQRLLHRLLLLLFLFRRYGSMLTRLLLACLFCFIFAYFCRRGPESHRRIDRRKDLRTEEGYERDPTEGPPRVEEGEMDHPKEEEELENWSNFFTLVLLAALKHLEVYIPCRDTVSSPSSSSSVFSSLFSSLHLFLSPLSSPETLVTFRASLCRRRSKKVSSTDGPKRLHLSYYTSSISCCDSCDFCHCSWATSRLISSLYRKTSSAKARYPPARSFFSHYKYGSYSPLYSSSSTASFPSRTKKSQTKRRSPTFPTPKSQTKRRSPTFLAPKSQTERRPPTFLTPKPQTKRRSPTFSTPKPQIKRRSPQTKRRSPTFPTPKSQTKRRPPTFLTPKPQTKRRPPTFSTPKPQIKRRSPQTKRRSPTFPTPKPQVRRRPPTFLAPKSQTKRHPKSLKPRFESAFQNPAARKRRDRSTSQRRDSWQRSSCPVSTTDCPPFSQRPRLSSILDNLSCSTFSKRADCSTDHLEERGVPVFKWWEVKPYLGAKLGEGCYGDVYALRWTERLPPACIKLGKSPSYLDLFIAEVKHMIRLRHTAVPRVVGIVLDPPGIIMKRHQVTLQDWVEECHPPARKVLQVLLTLCKIVEEIHLAGYCHNDLKPNNVMLDFPPRGIKVTVIDLGIMLEIGKRPFSVRDLDSDELEVLRRKMPWYAPKILLGEPCRPSTDAYSLAYVIWWCFRKPGRALGTAFREVLRWFSLCYGYEALCSVQVLIAELETALLEDLERNWINCCLQFSEQQEFQPANGSSFCE
ncbi:probable serine/threonine-protein kinase DDB_G0281745 [Macrobrachium rosenbergii]|uniref:probable serine/threonine-protein kinase DDB_G0281745 n=1 Tax=Macrobrachium rosenbergii TaxID=79674 RepID=UPI0034D41AA5